MTARRLILALSTVLAFGAGALHAQGTQTPPIPHKPLIVYQMSGGSGASAVLRILTVYDDGNVTFVKQFDVGPAKVRRAVLEDQTVDLVAALNRAGAMRLAGLNNRSDVPMTTVTAFAYTGKAGRPSVNSFNYYAPQGAYAQVDAAIRSFLIDAFGNY